MAVLCEDVYGEVADAHRQDEAWGDHLPRLAKWLQCIIVGWPLPSAASEVPFLAKMLAGAVIAPLLLEPSTNRHTGAHEVVPVIIEAGAGTGKVRL